MKRIYLTGAAILLFIFLAFDYYKKRLPPVFDNQLSAQTLNNTQPVAQPDNSTSPQTQPVVQTEKREAGQRSDRQVYNSHKNQCNPRHASRKATVTHKATPQYTSRKSHVAPKQNCPVLVSAPAATTTHSTPIQLDVQVTREYTGNRPAVSAPPATNRAITSHIRHHMRQHNFPIGIGIEGGMDEAAFYHSNTSNIRTGNLHAGIIGNINFGDNFALQPSLRYIARGNRLEDPTDAGHNEKINLRYFELPLNLVVKFGNPDDARFMMGVGPYVAYLAYADDHFFPGESGTEGRPAMPRYPASTFNNWDWGIGGFVGAQTPEGVFLKAGIEYGLANIIKNPAIPDATDRNYSILVTGGIILNSRK